ncbi:hypothetical protein SEA_FUZZBUSTER_75 [Microbacterium phage FuzzBuster]|uniref:Uncharacterized protein n=1 Tax=Microbacterium phage FuzzBuster TaxID=2590935 RepID=A0A516KV44_9CAUD|nr:hypothetical protein SEA_FUZZBUSTER_75 [Microbacterium phage FuzzBuster]
MAITYPATIIDGTGRTWSWSDDWGGYRSEGMTTHGYDTIASQWGIRPQAVGIEVPGGYGHEGKTYSIGFNSGGGGIGFGVSDQLDAIQHGREQEISLHLSLTPDQAETIGQGLVDHARAVRRRLGEEVPAAPITLDAAVAAVKASCEKYGLDDYDGEAVAFLDALLAVGRGADPDDAVRNANGVSVVEIVQRAKGGDPEEVVKTMTFPNERLAEKAESGANINLDHERYFTRII